MMTNRLIDGIISLLMSIVSLRGGNKPMIRPVVSLCQMAMNESIATTCCYKRVSDNIAETPVTLHGGKLSNKANTKYFFPGGGEIPGMWLNKSVKIRPVSAEAANGVSSIS